MEVRDDLILLAPVYFFFLVFFSSVFTFQLWPNIFFKCLWNNYRSTWRLHLALLWRSNDLTILFCSNRNRWSCCTWGKVQVITCFQWTGGNTHPLRVVNEQRAKYSTMYRDRDRSLYKSQHLECVCELIFFIFGINSGIWKICNWGCLTGGAVH